MASSDLPTRSAGIPGKHSTFKNTNMPTLSAKQCTTLSCLFLTLAVPLLVIVLPLSFQYLDYYEYGLLRRRSTGSMNLDKVYGPGRYMKGPDMTFKVFKASAHHVVLKNVSVVSSDKLETIIDVEYVYMLNRDQLIQLHNSFERQYRPVVEARAIDAIKNTAPNHTTSDFFLRRNDVSNDFFNAVKAKLEEVYCILDVFYLQKATIPTQVSNRQLETAIQNEANAREAFVAQATLARQQTALMVNDINNNASLQITQANANSSTLISNAQAEARHTMEAAEYQGLQNMYRQLGIKDPGQKASLDYIRTLRENVGVTWHLGYNTKVATFPNTPASG